LGGVAGLKILLDTHIWLWLVSAPDKIGKHLRRDLEDPDNELWLSPISTWEILVLANKRRIQLNREPSDWVASATAPFQESPLTHEITLVAHRLALPQRDPADRFLAATAKVLGLTLATADTKLLGLGDIATLANR
jgi:PIN domain nuclease of toxin-antitoxin system